MASKDAVLDGVPRGTDLFARALLDWASRGNPTWEKGEWRAALDRFLPLSTEAESLTGRVLFMGARRSVKARTPIERRALRAVQHMAERDHPGAVREKAVAFLEAAGLPTDAASVSHGGQMFVAEGLTFMEVGFAYKIAHLASLRDGPDHCAIAFEMGAAAREWQIVTEHGSTLEARRRFTRARPRGGHSSGKTRRKAADEKVSPLVSLVREEEKRKGEYFRSRADAAKWILRDHNSKARGQKPEALAKALERAGYAPRKT